MFSLVIYLLPSFSIALTKLFFFMKPDFLFESIIEALEIVERIFKILKDIAIISVLIALVFYISISSKKSENNNIQQVVQKVIQK